MGTKQEVFYQAAHNCLAGIMTGDTLGLPYEGMTPSRIAKFTKGNLKQNLVFGRAMVSDDTEHAFMTCLAVAQSPDDVKTFKKKLGWRLKWWLLRLPAGLGMATARAIFKLWLGFPVNKSGVRSAGNGPAMRAPILGVLYHNQPSKLVKYVTASTTLTHNDPKAILGAMAAAVAARHHMHNQQTDFSKYRRELMQMVIDQPDEEIKQFDQLLSSVQQALSTENDIDHLVEKLHLQKGITGFIYHTMPVVLFFAFCGMEFREAIKKLVFLGGDTDTTAAIVGGILGAGLHWKESDDYLAKSSIANDLEKVTDWPVNPSKIDVTTSIACKAVENDTPYTQRAWTFGPFALIRNMIFLVIVLTHGFRRLLPPY